MHFFHCGVTLQTPYMTQQPKGLRESSMPKWIHGTTFLSSIEPYIRLRPRCKMKKKEKVAEQPKLCGILIRSLGKSVRRWFPWWCAVDHPIFICSPASADDQPCTLKRQKFTVIVALLLIMPLERNRNTLEYSNQFPMLEIIHVMDKELQMQ